MILQLSLKPLTNKTNLRRHEYEQKAIRANHYGRLR